MGRPKGSKNRFKTNGAESGAYASTDATIGHNGGPVDLSDDQRQALFWNQHKPSYEKALAAKKIADAAFKNTCKLAKSELGNSAVDDIKLAIEAETPEGEAVIKERMESQARVLRWFGLPVGEQGTLFPADLSPAVDRARADGKREGFKGEPCKPPHDPSVPQHAAWTEGWQDGQAVLLETKLRPMQDDIEDVRPRFMQNDPGESIGDQPPSYVEE